MVFVAFCECERCRGDDGARWTISPLKDIMLFEVELESSSTLLLPEGAGAWTVSREVGGAVSASSYPPP